MYKILLSLATLYIMTACASRADSFRLPASIDGTAPNPTTYSCGMICAVGPMDKKYFHVRSIKKHKFENSEVIQNGSISKKQVQALAQNCKGLAESMSLKTQKKYGYISLSQAAPVYYGQIMKVKDEKVRHPNQGYEMNLYNTCVKQKLKKK